MDRRDVTLAGIGTTKNGLSGASSEGRRLALYPVRQPNLPIALNYPVEGVHATLPLAILRALVDARRRLGTEVRPPLRIPLNSPRVGNLCDAATILFESFFAAASLTCLCRLYEDATCSVSNSYPLKRTFGSSETNDKRRA